MKKLLFLVFCLFTTPALCVPYKAALVADMDNGQVLYQENANVLNYPASLTKIMTLYLTFDALEHGRLHLDDHLIVSQKATQASPVKLGLVAGSKIKVEDAIKALTVLSANDVARVLAENLKGGEENNFASLMTRVAAEIGLSNTNFENSSGLPDDDHLSTARDIALLSLAVYRHFPQYWNYFSIKNWTYNGKTYTNGNRLLGSYPGCDGMKTGFTNKSRYSLVSTAKRQGKHLMAVVLGAENKDIRAQVSEKLLDEGFELYGLSPVHAMAGYSLGKAAPVRKNLPPDYDVSAPTISAAYEAAVAAASPTATPKSSGEMGIQFGAFSTKNSALSQVENVKDILGINAVIEKAPSGLFRVRVNNLSEGEAQKLKVFATNAGIDNYVFHKGS